MAAIAAAPAWGSLSERIGRRPVLLIGLAAASIAPVVLAVVVGLRIEGQIAVLTALGAVFVVRLIQAPLGAGLMPAAQAFLADSTSPERRASGMALLGASFGIGTIVGSAIAWRLGGHDAVSAFGVVAAVLASGLLVVWWLVPEPVRQSCADTPRSRLPLSTVWPSLTITFLAISCYGVLQQVFALRLQDALGFDVERSISGAGAAIMATALVMVLVQAVVVRGFGWPARRLLIVGAVGTCAAMVALAFARDYATMVGAMIAIGGSLGLMLPGNLAVLSLSTGPDAQGRIAGINAIGQGLGMAAGPLIGASLHQISPTTPIFAASAAMAVVCGLAVVAGKRSRPAIVPHMAGG